MHILRKRKKHEKLILPPSPSHFIADIHNPSHTEIKKFVVRQTKSHTTAATTFALSSIVIITERRSLWFAVHACFSDPPVSFSEFVLPATHFPYNRDIADISSLCLGVWKITQD